MKDFTDLVVKLLRSGYSITEIEEALLAELESVKKAKPLLLAQKESNHAP